jgi:hypothetical protein
VALPPTFLRPSYREGWIASTATVVDPRSADLPSLPVAVASLLAVVALLGGLLWDAHRRRDVLASRLLATALLALAVATVTAARAPLGFFGVPLHLFRWLWAVAAFMALAVVVTVIRRLPARWSGWAVGGATAVAVVLGAANLPASDQGTIAPPGSIGATRDLNRQLGAVEGVGTVLVDVPERFNEPFGSAVMAELQRRGVPFVVEPGWERQLGATRRLRPGVADAALRIVTGDAARDPAPGTNRVAFHEGLRAPDRRRLAAATDAVAAAALQGRIRLNERGEAERQRGELPWFASRWDEQAVERLLSSRGVLRLVQDDLLDVGAALAADLDRYAELQARADGLTVAVLLDRLTPEEQATGR